MNANPRRISREKLYSLFDPSVHHNIDNLLTMSGVDGIAVFENLAMDSSQFGRRQAIAYGPDCTYARLADLKDGHLGDVPSRFTYCTMYYRKGMRDPVLYVEVETFAVKFVRPSHVNYFPRHYRRTGDAYKWEAERFGAWGRSGVGHRNIHYSFD